MLDSTATQIRHDWQSDEVLALYALPFNDLLFKAQSIHRANCNFKQKCLQMFSFRLINIFELGHKK